MNRVEHGWLCRESACGWYLQAGTQDAALQRAEDKASGEEGLGIGAVAANQIVEASLHGVMAKGPGDIVRELVAVHHGGVG